MDNILDTHPTKYNRQTFYMTVSEWVIMFNGLWGAAGIVVYVFHTIRVIKIYLLESLSSLA